MKGPTHGVFVVAAAAGLLAFVAAGLLSLPLPYTVGANIFFFSYAGMVLAKMPKMTTEYLHANARRADLPVLVIFLVTLLIVGIALGALFSVMNARTGPRLVQLVFALASVPLGWFTIQAMAALHYAHLYWVRDDDAEPENGMRAAGGLDFAGSDPPEGWDFLYFAATIGMTAQTADTAITSSAMRRNVLVHAIVSFFFNAVIVAAAVNLAVTLGG